MIQSSVIEDIACILKFNGLDPEYNIGPDEEPYLVLNTSDDTILVMLDGDLIGIISSQGIKTFKIDGNVFQKCSYITAYILQLLDNVKRF
jgi:hypothetical protein